LLEEENESPSDCLGRDESRDGGGQQRVAYEYVHESGDAFTHEVTDNIGYDYDDRAELHALAMP